MSVASSSASEVLRGMNVEAIPLRLVRAPTREEAASPAPVAHAREQEAFELARRQHLEDAARQGHEEGLRAGHEAGLRKGLADAEAEVQAAVQRAVAKERAALAAQREGLTALAGEMRKAMAQVLAAAEDEMVALCFETLCRMVGDPAVQVQAVRAQLVALASQVRPGDLVAIHVHPDQLAALEAACAADGRAIPLIGDADVGAGGCIVRCKTGALDARLETMLGECKAALLDARAQSATTAASSL